MTLANRTLDAARRARTAASRAASATYDAIAPEVIARYEKTMAANAEYVVRDPARAKRLGREFVYTNLARLPRAIEAATRGGGGGEGDGGASASGRGGRGDDRDGGGVRGGVVRVVLRGGDRGTGREADGVLDEGETREARARRDETNARGSFENKNPTRILWARDRAERTPWDRNLTR